MSEPEPIRTPVNPAAIFPQPDPELEAEYRWLYGCDDDTWSDIEYSGEH